MKRLVKILAILVTVTMLVTFAACGGGTAPSASSAAPAANAPQTDNTVGSSPEPVSLKIWAPKEEQEITKQMCEAFAAQHPEYSMTFEYSVVEYDTVAQDWRKDLDATGDVVQFPTGAIPELAEAGMILPITIDADAIKEAHGAAAIKSCTLNDLLYAVPLSPNSWFMYYDKSKYTEDDVKSLEKMMAKDLGSGVANFSSQITNSWYIEAWFYAAGATLFGADGTDPTSCTWNGPEGLAAGKYLINMVNNPKYVEDKDGLARTLMLEGKLAALCSGTWSANDMMEALGDNYAACKLPTVNINGEDRQLSNFADFKAIGVKSSTKHPKAAQQLANFMNSEENQLLRFRVNVVAPTIKSLITNSEVQANQAVAALSDQTQYSTPNPTTSKLADYWTPVQAFGEEIYSKTCTEANLQERLDAVVKGIISALVS